MDEQFAHPSGQVLLEEVRKIFEQKPIFQTRNRPIVFLCGGPVAGRSRNMRRAFLTWSKHNLPDLTVLLAEDAYKHTKIYEPPETLNLAEFEELIGTVANCILVFPESEGSFAELGLFSGGEIRKKVLVANHAAYQAKESFINLGPIKTIDLNSYLSPTVVVSKRHGRFDFEPVRERLGRLMERTKRTSFAYRPYKKLDQLEKLLIALEMVNIFRLVTLSSLEACVRAVFDNASPRELKPIVSILAGAGFIRIRDHYFSVDPGKDSLLQFEGIKIDQMKARVLHYYQQHRPSVYQQFQRAQNASR